MQSAEPAVVASDALAPLGAVPAGPLLTQLIAAPAHRTLARQWSDARPGGWNAQDANVAGALRIPVEELPQGFGGKDPQLQYTKESAEKRAIVVVPDAVDLSGPVEVLLHFHGQNIGYRERSKERTVRDVEVDEIEQQIVAAGRNMVAVLPQGSRGSGPNMSKFTIGDPKTYVDDVLRLASAHLPGSRLPAGGVMKSGRLVMSGHSGGGPYAVAYAHYAQQPSSTEQEWVDAPPLLLFDGINGKDELKTLQQNLETWLAEDLRWITQAADQAALLGRRGLKLRSTWGTGSDPIYQQMNAALDTWLTARFAKLAAGLDPGVASTWRAQYRVERREGQHDYQVGTGRPATPSERDAAGVPLYTGGGNLEAGLRGLRANPVVARRRRGGSRATANQMLRLQRTVGNRALSRAVLARQTPQRRFETPDPLRASEANPAAGQPSAFIPTIIVKEKFAVFVPMGWIAKYNLVPAEEQRELKVHVFFGAGGVKGNNFNDVLLHGLRSASNATEWITIAVPGSATDDGQSFATPFSDSDITDCLAAANITWPVTSLRLSGHSRGMVSLTAYAAKMKAYKSVLDRVHVLDEFQFHDKAGTYHGKVESLIQSGIPKDKIRGYESGDPAEKHVKDVDYVKFDAQAIAAVGAVRMIQDAIALNPSVATAAAATKTTKDPVTKTMRTVKDEVDSLTLPTRGSLPSRAPAGTDSLQSWMAAHKKELSAISAGHLGTFITTQNLTRYRGISWVPFLAHEFFVAEIAPELYQ